MFVKSSINHIELSKKQKNGVSVAFKMFKRQFEDMYIIFAAASKWHQLHTIKGKEIGSSHENTK